MSIFVDPSMSADDPRQKLYDGNLVILTRLEALSEFVESTRTTGQRVWASDT